MSPSAPTRTNFTVDGHPTAAWVHSSGSSARPVLMVHGFRGDHHGMDLIAGAIRDRDVIVGDLPGFGLTPPLATGLSLDAYCDHLAGLVAEVTRRWQAAPIVLGHSFGSILVAHTAARQPSTA
ncbi:MAG: alpha/beta fold hydrolase, partial [Brevibacterium aurantiacum]|nr:alpha/beta fold hydrolase [Brevibacterium aurantiacum]